MKKIDKETIEFVLQGGTALTIAFGVVASNMFYSGKSIVWLGVFLLIAMFIYMKLMSMRVKGILPNGENDRTAKILTWMVFVWMGGVLGWLILVLFKICFVIWFLVEFIVALTNS